MCLVGFGLFSCVSTVADKISSSFSGPAKTEYQPPKEEATLESPPRSTYQPFYASAPLASDAVVANHSQPYDVECKVVGVADGDTFTCLASGNKQIKVRLNQIDAPEKKQDFGNAAKQALSAYVFGKLVQLHTSGQDKYGRTIAEVFVGSENVNKKMVSNGHAWAYREYMKDPEYAVLENHARSRSLGLWSQPNPIYPSEFRHGERPKTVTQEVQPQRVSPNGSGKFTCSGKRFCREMNSCEEAKFYLNQCGVNRLDRDGDGIPCESIC